MRRSGRLVTYELFLTAYWPHFSQKLTKGLGKCRGSIVAVPRFTVSQILHSSSARLWVRAINNACFLPPKLEQTGVIKGSEEASLLAGRCLDRQTYEGLSVRRQSTFANRRGLIYDIFLQYTKEKASRNDYDAADRLERAACDIHRLSTDAC